MKQSIQLKRWAWVVLVLVTSTTTSADLYEIDTSGTHAFIQFKISHLGYSWLYGGFNKFSGTFEYDEEHPERSIVNVSIKTSSLDSNHALRDKHLRGKKFLYVKKHPKAMFVSRSYDQRADGSAVMKGDFTLRGVTKTISIDVVQVGAGNDPWGGYRRGFEGKTVISLADYNMDAKSLGKHAQTMEITLSVEGVRQKDDTLTQ